jgi:hypothetical protein
MLVCRPVAQIVDVQVNRAAFLRTLHHAFAERGATDFGKESEDIDLHPEEENVERQTPNVQCFIVGRFCETPNVASDTDALQFLFHDFEGGALSVAAGGAGQQRPDRLDRLAVAPDDPADVGLAKLHAKDRRLSRWDFGKHHLIGKLDELANDEFEELFHESEATRSFRSCHAGGSSGRSRTPRLIVTQAFSLIRLADILSAETQDEALHD